MARKPWYIMDISREVQQQTTALAVERGWSEDYAAGWILGHEDGLEHHKRSKSLAEGQGEFATGYRGGFHEGRESRRGVQA